MINLISICSKIAEYWDVGFVLPEKPCSEFFCAGFLLGFKNNIHVDFSSLKPSLACKIFDTTISPILTYNSVVWGLFIKSDFKYWDTSPIEKGHLQFCKRYLQVNNKASNIACRAELGRYPLMFDINKRILKYISYLQNKEQSSLVIQS